MQTDKFIKELTEWLQKDDYFQFITLGKDMSVNTRLVIDEDGFIWIRDGGSGLTWNRVKTNVNVLKIVEFRASDDDYTSFL